MTTGKNKGGRPKGWDKERQRQKLREQFFQHQDAIVEAQIKNSLGIKYLVSRDRKSGKFSKLSAEQAESRLSDEAWLADNEIIEIWEERPNVQAFTGLADRALGKPTEHIEQEISGGLELTWKSE